MCDNDRYIQKEYIYSCLAVKKEYTNFPVFIFRCHKYSDINFLYTEKNLNNQSILFGFFKYN